MSNLGPPPGSYQVKSFGADGRSAQATAEEARQYWGAGRRLPRTWWGRCVALLLMAMAVAVAAVLVFV